MAIDHLNIIERKLIDNLRSGTYNTTDGIGSGSAWTAGDVTVFGQFPEAEDVKYPCLIVEQVANGTEQQFMGQRLTSGGATAVGELYGVGYNIYAMISGDNFITIDATDYKQRRLMNYLMNNAANVIMDCDFTTANADGDVSEVVQRNFGGFTDIGYNPELELWFSQTTLIIIFKNSR